MIPKIYKLFVAMLMLAGCQSEGRAPAALLAGKSVEGRPIQYYVMGEGKQVVLFIATIHGNEHAGTPLMRTLMDYLGERPEFLEGYKAVIIPVMNPDGYAKNTRGNINGVDLNRNFPATNRKNNAKYGSSGLSEPESKAIFELLHKFNPVRIVVAHQPWAIVDWDGPGQPLAEHMARHTIHPAKRIGSRPGSLGSYAGGDLGIPIITWEFPGKAHENSPEKLWRMYGRSLVAALVYPEDVTLKNFQAPYDQRERTVILVAPVVMLAVASLAGWLLLIYLNRRKP